MPERWARRLASLANLPASESALGPVGPLEGVKFNCVVLSLSSRTARGFSCLGRIESDSTPSQQNTPGVNKIRGQCHVFLCFAKMSSTKNRLSVELRAMVGLQTSGSIAVQKPSKFQLNKYVVAPLIKLCLCL